MGESVLPFVISLRPRAFASRALASGAHPSFVLSASVCFGAGRQEGEKDLAGGFRLKAGPSVGQYRPPPTLSISANEGEGFSANSRRISVALSGFAFRQMLS